MALGTTQPTTPKYFQPWQNPALNQSQQSYLWDQNQLRSVSQNNPYQNTPKAGQSIDSVWGDLSAKAKAGDRDAAFRLSQIGPMYGNYMTKINQGMQLANTPQSNFNFGQPQQFGQVSQSKQFKYFA